MKDNEKEIIITKTSTSHYLAQAPVDMRDTRLRDRNPDGRVITKGSKVSVTPLQVLEWLKEGYTPRVYERIIGEEDLKEIQRKRELKKELQAQIKAAKTEIKFCKKEIADLKKKIKNKKELDTRLKEFEDRISAASEAIETSDSNIKEQGLVRISLSASHGIEQTQSETTSKYLGKVLPQVEFKDKSDHDKFVSDIIKVIKKYAK